MKKSKILVPALGILVLSTAASITGTVAWFTAANSVDVSGARMKAEVEQGIVIANETHAAAADWNLTATASHTGEVSSVQQAFIPTSTADAATFYHANSAHINNADASQAAANYKSFTEANAAAEGKYVVDANGIATASIGSATKNIFLKNTFYVQSSNLSTIANQDLFIKDLEVTGSSSSVKLNYSLRMAVVCNSTVSIFHMFADDTDADPDIIATKSYTVGGTTAVTTKDAITADTEVIISGAAGLTIPAYTINSSTIQIDTYLYFEGEDANCKSENITASMDTLAVSFKIGNKSHS